MFNLTNIPVHVNDVIFGDVSEITKDAPARTAGAVDSRQLVSSRGRSFRRACCGGAIGG